MAIAASSTPVGDSVTKVNNEVAVGEDLHFQRKWWRFEAIVWTIFVVILLLDISGVFGRGPLAKAQKRTADGTLDIRYDRIERTGTPSFMVISFSQSAIHDGAVQLFVNEAVVKELGAQRIIPAPVSTSIGNGGLLYTFPATSEPASVEIALQPSGPGIFHLIAQVPGFDPVSSRIVVVP